MALGVRRVRWIGIRGCRELRAPWAIVRRGLGGGAAAGALIGAGLQGGIVVIGSSGSPGLLASVLFAGVVGALVALPAALMAVIVYQALEDRGLTVSSLAGSLAAATTVLVTATLLGMIDSLLAVVCAVATFVVALAWAPRITTRRATGPHR